MPYEKSQSISLEYARITDFLDRKRDPSAVCNARVLRPIPGSVRERSALYSYMEKGTPLLLVAIARQGAKCFGASRDQAEADDLVERLLAFKNINVHMRGCYGETALHRAVEAHDLEIARKLRKLGVSRGIENVYGETAYDKATAMYEYMVTSRATDDMMSTMYQIIKCVVPRGVKVPSEAVLQGKAEHAQMMKMKKAVIFTAEEKPVTVPAKQFTKLRLFITKQRFIMEKLKRYDQLYGDGAVADRRRAQQLMLDVDSCDDMDMMNDMIADFLNRGLVGSLSSDKSTGLRVFITRSPSSATKKDSLRYFLSNALGVDLLNGKVKLTAIKAALVETDKDDTKYSLARSAFT